MGLSDDFLTAALKQACLDLDAGADTAWPLELIHLSQDLICVANWDDRRIVYLNDAGRAFLDIGEPAAALGRDFADFLHRDYRECLIEEAEALAEAHETFPVKLVGATGQIEDSELRLARIVTHRGPALLIVAHNITRRLAAANHIVASERRYRNLINNALDLIVVCDENGIHFVNAAGIKMLGARDEADILGKQIWEFLHKDYRDLFEGGGLSAVLAEEEAFIPVRAHTLDGRVRDLELAFVALGDPSAGYMVEARDITSQNQAVAALRRTNENLEHLVDERTAALSKEIVERKKAEEIVRRQATYDALTGLPNRSLFFERLHQEVSQASREEQRLALMFIDLDGFKQINDVLGHDAGDLLLKETGRRLKSCVRESDTVARLAGDEFTIILAHQEGVENSAATAQRIIDTLEQPFLLEGSEGNVSASIGIAVFPIDAHDDETLIKHADAAMYRAKKLGKANYQYYTASLSEEAHSRKLLADGLASALVKEEFSLVYQPTIDLNSGRVFELEALLRWESQALGTVATSEFIPVLEKGGMVNEVGEWIVRHACQRHSEWADHGCPDMRVALNISTRQLRYPGFVDTLADIVKTMNLSGASLALEVREGAVLSDVAQTRALLDRIKALGIRITLDDFGTGMGAINALRDMPIDAIKIDHSLIGRVTDSEQEKDTVGALIAMGHSFGRIVVAEGVETAAQLAALRELGCDGVQGYLICKPLKSADVPSFIKTFSLPGS